MADTVITQDGINAVHFTYGSGSLFALKYFLPIYDPRIDPNIHNTPPNLSDPNSILELSASTPVSADSSNLFGDRIFNLVGNNISDTAFYLYRIDGEGSLTISGSNATLIGITQTKPTHTNLYKNKAMPHTSDIGVEVISGSNIVGSNGSFNITDYGVVQREDESLFGDLADRLFKVHSFSPSLGVSADRGQYTAVLDASVGNFKFNKIAFYIQKVNSDFTDYSGFEPILFAITPISSVAIKTSGSDINNSGIYGNIGVDGMSRIDHVLELEFSTDQTLTNTTYQIVDYWTALPAQYSNGINFMGDVVVGSSAIDGSYDPLGHLTSWDQDKAQLALAYDLDKVTYFTTTSAGYLKIETSGATTSLVSIGQNEITGQKSTAIGDSNISSGIYSIAIGNESSATNINACAIGYRSLASGQASMAIGSETEATGTYSFATGKDTSATGTYSSSFGYKTKASNIGAVAFGSETEATGTYSFATGKDTSATGIYSSSFGEKNESLGSNSLVTGYKNKTWNHGSLVLGKMNVDGTSANSASDNSYGNSLVIGYLNINESVNSIVGGNNNNNTAYSSLIVGTNNSTSGTYSLIAGNNSNIKAISSLVTTIDSYVDIFSSSIFGSNQYIIGSYLDVNGSSNVVSADTGSVYRSTIKGQSNIVTGEYSFTFGNSNQVLNKAQYCFIYGSNNTIGEYTLSGSTESYKSFIFGNDNNIYKGYNNLVVGALNEVSASYSTTFGYNNKNYSDNSLVGGEESVTGRLDSPSINKYSIAWGYQAVARGKYSQAFGNNVLAYGENSFAIGTNIVASSPSSIMGGIDVTENLTSTSLKPNIGLGKSISLNTSSFISNGGAVVLGSYHDIQGSNSFTAGYGNNTFGQYDVNIGNNNITGNILGELISQKNMVIGSDNIVRTSSFDESIAIGFANEVYMPYAIALGRDNIFNGGGIGGYSIGYSNTVYGANSFILGHHTRNTAANSMIFNLETQIGDNRKDLGLDGSFIFNTNANIAMEISNTDSKNVLNLTIPTRGIAHNALTITSKADISNSAKEIPFGVSSKGNIFHDNLSDTNGFKIKTGNDNFTPTTQNTGIIIDTELVDIEPLGFNVMIRTGPSETGWFYDPTNTDYTSASFDKTTATYSYINGTSNFLSATVSDNDFTFNAQMIKETATGKYKLVISNRTGSIGVDAVNPVYYSWYLIYRSL